MKTFAVSAAIAAWAVAFCCAQERFEITFRYDDPKANSVGLACECTDWTVLFMTRDARGNWSKTISLPPGTYAYRFLVNGKDWELDPANPDRTTTGGKEYSVLAVGKNEPAPEHGTKAGPAPAAARETKFAYTNATAKEVFLAGQFNGWSSTATPMQKSSAGVWSVTLELDPGRYQYKFVVDGLWQQDIFNPEAMSDGYGGLNSVKFVGESGAADSKRRLSQVQCVPNRVTVFEMPFSPTAWSEAARLPKPQDDDVLARNAKPRAVRVGLAVPRTFDPTRKWPLLIVSGTADESSIEHLHQFFEPATESGWVALAADAWEKPKNDSNAWRWALVGSVLETLHNEWPASTKWPVACAGFDGGAKYAAFLAALLTKEGLDVIGVWLGGYNQDAASAGLNLYSPSHARFTSVPFFLSSGSDDRVATPAQIEDVLQSMRSKGFKRVHWQSHDGGHEPSPEHVRHGLDWFVDPAKR